MTIQSKYDVLIVGAGPTGLSVAAELLRGGVSSSSILLIDALPAPLIQTKASVLWPRSLELLSQFKGVLEETEAYGLRLSRAVIRTNDDKLLGRVDFAGNTNSEFGYGILCEQWFTEKVITRYINEMGLTVVRSTSLGDFKYRDLSADHPITASLLPPSGPLDVSIKYIVGCDGSKSACRKLAGIKFGGETLEGTFYSAHFSVKKPLTSIDGSMVMFLRSEGMSFITQMPNGTYMTAIDLVGEQAKPYLSATEVDMHGNPILLDITEKDVARLLKERIHTDIQVDKIIWQTHFRVNERVAARYSDGKRVFLAGDACHAHTPLGGQGQNTGIQEAINLGWKLALVLQGTCSPTPLLSSYESERLAIGQHLINFTTVSQKSSASRNPYFQFLRNHAMSLATSQHFVVSTIAQTIGETIYHYRDSGISAEHWEKPPLFPSLLARRRQNILRMVGKRINAGDRVSRLILSGVEESFFTETSGFKLVLFEGLESAYNNSSNINLSELAAFGQEMIAQTFGLISAFAVVPKDQVHEYTRFGVEGQSLFLLRPDGHVGFRSEPVSADLLKAYLRDRVGLQKFDKSAMPFTVKKFNPLVGDWFHLVLVGAVIAAGIAYAKS
ncbi:UNVERIFIED_CONTAM: hypothetical protein HDU68_001734 [Siphonaria sp. JEL0065]|nr:hypothetical protein HDU68_001734 [Siphonaria sp. JEL0065]